ncbi:MAG: hypothetical protein QF886_21965, partial [Planctomycetota bacterium]|nr:hypothetical protein [Planctomycetota bacterium]
VVLEALVASAWPAPGVAIGALDLLVAAGLTIALGAVGGALARLVWRRAALFQLSLGSHLEKSAKAPQR